MRNSNVISEKANKTLSSVLAVILAFSLVVSSAFVPLSDAAATDSGKAGQSAPASPEADGATAASAAQQDNPAGSASSPAASDPAPAATAPSPEQAASPSPAEPQADEAAAAEPQAPAAIEPVVDPAPEPEPAAPAEQEPAAKDAGITVKADNAVVTIDGIAYDAVSSPVTVAIDADLVLKAAAKEGFELDKVEKVVKGVATKLAEESPGTYRIAASDISDGLVVSAVATEKKAEEAAQGEQPQGTASDEPAIEPGSKDDAASPSPEKADDAAVPEATTHTVTFYYHDTVVFDAVQKVEDGKTATAPDRAPPAEEGYSFDAWYAEGHPEAPYEFDTPVKADLNLYAKYLEAGDGEAEEAAEEADAENAASDTDTGILGMIASFFSPKATPAEVAETPASVYHTVTLQVGNSSSTVQVMHGALLAKPETPANPSDTKPFHAWYQDGQSQPFDFRTPITKDIALKAVFGTKHTVTFMDYKTRVEASDHVLQLQAYEDGAEFDASKAPTPNMPIGVNFNFWSTEKDGTTPFTGKVTADVTLYPVAGHTTIAVFITDGPNIDTQSSTASSFTPTQPSGSLMVRAGYTFSKWSLDPAGETTYKFNTPIKGTTYIYAIWTPVKTGFILNFWNEKAGIAGDPGTDVSKYELVYTKPIAKTDALAVPTGSKVTGINSSIISTRTNYTSGGDFVANILDYSLYAWDDSGSKTLSGDGNTVINVYAKRITFNFTFDLTKTTAGAPGNAYASILTDPGGGDHTTYIVAAKLGQDVSNAWPSAVRYADPNSVLPAHKDYKFTNWKGYWSNGPRTIDWQSIQQLVKSGTKGYTTGGRTPATELVYTTAFPITPGYSGAPFSESRYYYTEMTEAEYAAKRAAGFGEISSSDPTQMKQPTESLIVNHTADGVERHYFFNQANGVITFQTSWGPKGWPGRTIYGFQTITNTGSQPYRMTDRYQVAPASGKDTADFVDYMGTLYSPISYYMPRATYDLNLITNGGKIANPGDFAGNPTSGYSQNMAFGTAIKLPDAPTKDGFDFKGWFLDEKLTTPYDPAEKGTMPGNNLTLYAKFVGNAVTVEYYEYEGKKLAATAMHANGDMLSETDLTENEDPAVRSWYNDVKGELRCFYFYTNTEPKAVGIANWGMILTAANTENGVLKLYTDYWPGIHPVKFMAKKTIGTSPVQYGDAVYVPVGNYNTLAYEGKTEAEINSYVWDIPYYRFTGWKTEEGTVFNTSSPVTKDLEVFAQYAPIEYNISYVLYGGKNDDANPSKYTVESYIELQKPSRAGYTFDGWYTDGTFDSKTRVDAITAGSFGDKTFYAKWEANGQTLSYDGNGATGGTTKETTGKTDESVKVAQNGFSRTGYSFTGWNTQADGKGKAYQPGSDYKLAASDNLLYAQWSADNAKIAFVTNGGTAVADMNGKTDGAITDQSMPPTTRTGYDFAGWYAKEDLSGEKVSSLPASYPAGTTTYYAKWTPKTDVGYTVHYYQVGTIVSLADDVQVTGKTFGQSYTESAKDIPGYKAAEPATQTFVLDKDGKEISFYYNQLYTVTYDLNGGSSDAPLQYAGLIAGDSTPKIGDPTRADDTTGYHYEFAGWSPAVAATVAGNATYTAQWKSVANADVTYTVHYYQFGTTNPVALDKTVEGMTFGQSYTESAKDIPGYKAADPTTQTFVLDKDGKELVFWYTAEEPPVDPKDPDTPDNPDNPVAVLYTVTYDLNGGSSNDQLVYTGLEAGTATPTIADPAREDGDNTAYEFAGWSPAVADTVTEDATYVAQWNEREITPVPPVAPDPVTPTPPTTPVTPTPPTVTTDVPTPTPTLTQTQVTNIVTQVNTSVSANVTNIIEQIISQMAAPLSINPPNVATEEIAEDGTPLAQGSRHADCWVHWLIGAGMLLTVAYAAAVVIRRRKFTNGLRGLEDDVLGMSKDGQPRQAPFNRPAGEGGAA